MEIKSIKSNIVILAEAHNPSIISPEWLKNKSIITEKSLQFVHTQPFSMFESASYILIVDGHRWQLDTKKPHESESIKSLAGIAEKYITLLPHIPYKSLGINHVYVINPAKDEKIPELNLRLKETSFNDILTGYEIKYGGMIYAKKASYLLRLTIETNLQKEEPRYNFNYHHDIKGFTIDKIRALVNNIVQLHTDSQNIVQKLYS